MIGGQHHTEEPGSSERLPTVVRNTGITPSERAVGKLCEHTFLSLWSYSGLYRDQGVTRNGDGKEICDLIVVFGNDIIVFSDKDCAFPRTGDLKTDWTRWYRRAVVKSAIQASGAERWIRQHPDRIFIDRSCQQRFPLRLPLQEMMRFHHVVVAHNASAVCRQELGGSGSLIYNSDLREQDHIDPKRCQPFHLGWLEHKCTFVHVLDDTSLEILLKSRDTITDFVDYLRAKELFLRSLRDKNIHVLIAGEEELLATYLFTVRGNSHGFIVPEKANSTLVLEGEWAHFLSSPQRAAQVQEDQVSYLWDDLIEKFNKNILDGTSCYVSSPSISDREQIMRFFAREPRLRRRLLASALLELLQKTPADQRSTRIICPSNPGDPYYCFVLLPRREGQPDADYREARRNLLLMLVHVVKLNFPEATDIVGLATETGMDTSIRSEDALYFNTRGWNDALAAQAIEWRDRFGLLSNVVRFEDRISEFPITTRSITSPGPNPRNKRCPCGSGRKYKHCHGR